MILTVFLLLICAGTVLAQHQGVNYDESKVLACTLPNPLVMANG